MLYFILEKRQNCFVFFLFVFYDKLCDVVKSIVTTPTPSGYSGCRNSVKNYKKKNDNIKKVAIQPMEPRTLLILFNQIIKANNKKIHENKRK